MTRQEISQMQSFNLCGTGLVQPGADLEQAARVGGYNAGRAGREHVLDLASLQTRGHVRLGQVVTSGTAATNIALRHLHKT